MYGELFLSGGSERESEVLSKHNRLRPLLAAVHNHHNRTCHGVVFARLTTRVRHQLPRVATRLLELEYSLRLLVTFVFIQPTTIKSTTTLMVPRDVTALRTCRTERRTLVSRCELL